MMTERASEFRQRRVYAWPFLFEELQSPGIVHAMSKCLYFTTRTMEKFPKVKKQKPRHQQHQQQQQQKKEEEKKEEEVKGDYRKIK